MILIIVMIISFSSEFFTIVLTEAWVTASLIVSPGLLLEFSTRQMSGLCPFFLWYPVILVSFLGLWETIPRAPITITFIFQSIFSSLQRSKYLSLLLSFIFNQCFVWRAKSTGWWIKKKLYYFCLGLGNLYISKSNIYIPFVIMIIF